MRRVVEEAPTLSSQTVLLFRRKKVFCGRERNPSDAGVELGAAGPSPAIWLPIHQVSDTFPPALDKDMDARKRRKP